MAKKNGICALLGIEGKFAKSHLIPRALTSTDVPGERLIEAGRGNRPIRRFNSWYDMELVITEGEKILSEIDDAGISELRKHQLVWGSWKNKKKLTNVTYLIKPDPETGMGMRQIDDIDSSKLRLFFLSLLWRSLKTKIEAFSYLPSDGVDLDKIGEMLINRDPGDPHFFPIYLDQITTRGFTHNHSPTLRDMEIENNGQKITLSYYRFYMQGLVAHMYLDMPLELFEKSNALYVGGSDKLILFTRKFEHTQQYQDDLDAVKESIDKWPSSMNIG